MRNLIIFLSLIFAQFTFGQYCPYLGPDVTLPCGVTQTTLTADLSQCGPGSNPNQTTNYTVTNIPFVGQPNAGTTVALGDDSQSGPFNIGFTFCYYGNTYTQFWIGSNGWISFSAGQPTTFTSNPIPTGNALTPKNCIMGPWQDWNPGIGGLVRYQVQGVAPCRRLIVSWINVPMFSCTNLLGTFHIVIYESTNVIENHIQNKPNCPQWAGGTAVQGVHNLLGTAAVTVPGRNSTQWTTQNNAYRWTPSGPQVTPTLTWFQVGNPIPIGTGPQITVTPNGPTQYTCQFVYPTCNAGWSQCNAGAGNLGPDTILVTPTPNLPPPGVQITNPLCNGDCTGQIIVTPIGGTAPITISWPGLVGNSLTQNGLCAGNYNFTLQDASGCSYQGLATIVEPAALPQPLVTGTNPLCYSYCDGQAVVNPVAGIAPYTYLWSDNQTGQTATGLCQGNFSVVVTDANGCQATGTVTLTDPPQVIINPIVGSDTVCVNSSNNPYQTSSVFNNLTYNWTSTIGTISGQGTQNILLDVTGVAGGLYPNALTVIGEDATGCLSPPQTFTIVVLDIVPQITPNLPLCDYDNCVQLSAQPVGGQFSGVGVQNSQFCPTTQLAGLNTITYTYIQSGCQFTQTSQIEVNPRPQFSIQIDGQITNSEYHELCEGDSITDTYVSLFSQPGYTEWSTFGDTLIGDQINLTWNQEGVFLFQATRWELGCQSYPQNITVTIQLCPQELIYIPNSFTPDGDEHNQYFAPIITSGVDIYQFHMTMYNRWGEMVWESFDVTGKWDGTYNNKICPDGIYNWTIEFGLPKNDGKKELQGSVRLLR